MSKQLTPVMTFLSGVLAVSSAYAAPVAPSSPVLPQLAIARAVEADCFAVGEDKAAELGGTLAKAKPDTEGGAPVCRLVIVVPGAEGERPKRVEIVVPQ